MEKKPQYQKGLHPDIVYEILLRLPVKTLSRFQCVCRTWHSIISDLSFREDHYRHSQQNPLLLITSHEFESDDDSDGNPVNKPKPNTNRIHLSSYDKEGILKGKFSKTELEQCPYVPIQSCLGLVCIGPNWYDNPILLCNPSTEELITLPPTRGYHLCIGIGYVTSTKEVKVVRFSRSDEVDHHIEDCCEVFILGASEWREEKNECAHPPIQFQFEWGAPFLQGGLHLLPCVDFPGPDDFIFVFDIDTEEYMAIPFPDYYHSEEVLAHFETLHLYLKEFEGSLYLIFDFTASLELWCLKDYANQELWCLKDYANQEWVKEYTIDLSPLGSDVSAEPIGIMGDGCVLLRIELEEGYTSLYCYSSCDKSFMRKVEAKGLVILYVESFFTLGSGH